jgi:hypothetical protein
MNGKIIINFVFETNGVSTITCGGGDLIDGERRYVVGVSFGG